MVAQVYFWTNMDNVISFIATNCYGAECQHDLPEALFPFIVTE